MRKTTEVITVKNFMKGNYHQDALGAVLGICTMMALPAYYCWKLGPGAAAIAYKALPIILAL
jgi:hypothetical protein